MKLFSNKFTMMQKGLDVSWMRNEVISNNIANAETANFKASKVEFESLLKSQLGNSDAKMKATNPKHINDTGNSINQIQPIIKKDGTSPTRLDGNNVNLENEMTDLAKNNLLYNTLIQKTGNEVSRMKFVINEGKR